MQISQMSNILLALGATLLVAFGVLLAIGLPADPIIAAVAGFFVGCSAILDRVTTKELS